MEECYIDVDETVTRNVSYSCSFDSANPSHADRGDESNSHTDNNENEDSETVRCGNCGTTFDTSDFVRVTGFSARPVEHLSREHDPLAKLFTKNEWRRVGNTEEVDSHAKQDARDNLCSTALRLALLTPLPFFLKADTITRIRRALAMRGAATDTQGFSPSDVRYRLWKELGEQFDTALTPEPYYEKGYTE